MFTDTQLIPNRHPAPSQDTFTCLAIGSISHSRGPPPGTMSSPGVQQQGCWACVSPRVLLSAVAFNVLSPTIPPPSVRAIERFSCRTVVFVSRSPLPSTPALHSSPRPKVTTSHRHHRQPPNIACCCCCCSVSLRGGFSLIAFITPARPVRITTIKHTHTLTHTPLN